MKTLGERFEQFDTEFLAWQLVANPRAQRRDLHAFLLLDELVPGTLPIICAAEHDEYYLEIDCEALNKAATDEQLLELRRCGIRYDSECDCLAVFA